MLIALGLNHRTAPLTLRERVAIAPRELPASLQQLRQTTGLSEAVLLSTCNRLEAYVVAAHPEPAVSALEDLLSFRSQLSPDTLRTHLYRFNDAEAVRHLFRVAAGLDSMILGESEITAQVKQAYLAAHAEGAAGRGLHRLFQKALHAAKEIRTRTTIGQGQASIGSVVAGLVRELFGDTLGCCDVLLWGAGQAAETTARHLLKTGIGQLWMVNRTQPKAEELARLCQGGWLSWEQALKHLAHVDIAVVCTQAPHYVIGQEDVEAVRAARGIRPLCLIDLAVPRNVDPALAGVPGVRLYNIDDLQALAAAGHAARQQTLAQCETMIDHQAALLLRRTSSAAVHPLLVETPSR